MDTISHNKRLFLQGSDRLRVEVGSTSDAFDGQLIAEMILRFIMGPTEEIRGQTWQSLLNSFVIEFLEEIPPGNLVFPVEIIQVWLEQNVAIESKTVPSMASKYQSSAVS